MAETPNTICPNCGTPAADQTHFCASCGTELPMQVEPQHRVRVEGRPVVEAHTLAQREGPGAAVGGGPAGGERGLGTRAGALARLSRYPYGCTEQLTSGAMPLLYLSGLESLEGITDASAAGTGCESQRAK